MILTCQNPKCAIEFNSRKSSKRFCCNDCYKKHRKNNPDEFSGGQFKKGRISWNKISKEKVSIRTIKAKDEDVIDFSDQSYLDKLVKGCISGNRKYQKILFDRMYGKMMGVAMRYTRDQDSAQDVISLAFIKVFDKIDTFKSGGSLEGWVRRIVTNTSIDHIRDANRKNTFSYDANEMSNLDNMQVEAEEFEFDLKEVRGVPVEKIMEAIQSLPPGYRASFNMFIIEGYTHKEIANHLGVKEGTSKSNLSKARDMMKIKVSKLIEDARINKIKREESAINLYKEADLHRV